MSILKTKTLTIKPKNTGSWISGRWTETVASTYEIKGSWQPANPRQVETLPEGRKDKETMQLITFTKLNTVQSSKNPDIIIVDGVEYEIYSRADHQNILKHYVYLAVAI